MNRLFASILQFTRDRGPHALPVALRWLPLWVTLAAPAAFAALNPLGSVQQLAVGSDHACALFSTGTVACWGNNEYGQLGNGSLDDAVLPQDIPGLDGVIQIGAGYRHSCALLQNGTVKCWGKGFLGALGNGSLSDRSVPTVVTGLSSVASLAVGGDHTCVLRGDARAWCWGYNGMGAVGIGDPGTNIVVSPTIIAGAYTWSQLSAGESHVCGLSSGGVVYCWGVYDRACNLVGCGFAYDVSPQAVPGLASAVSQISAGHYFTCVVTTAGAVRCWGDNYHGQLGDLGTENPDPFLLVDIANLQGGVAEVSAGNYHACARLTNGQLRCWGENRSGILGDGSIADAWPPRAVIAPADAASIHAGSSLTCARTSDARARCWGGNGSGQLGDGDPWRRLEPVAVANLSAIQKLSSAGSHTCAIGAAGQVQCWGDNASGQLGDGTREMRPLPSAPVALPGAATDISASPSHTCAVVAGGAWCWGQNTRGQLGDNSQIDRLQPVAVVGLSSGVVAVRTGGSHSCARMSDGRVRCWGENGNGQLGFDFTSPPKLTPVLVPSITAGTSDLTAGGGHTCAIATGTVYCWGSNQQSQIGEISDPADQPSPHPLTYVSNPMSVVAGLEHSCALEAGGRAWCWGSQQYGQLGTGFAGPSGIPWPQVPVGLDSGAAQMAIGMWHTCARMTSGELRCWGNNSSGQLGDGSRAERRAPVTSLMADAGTSIALGASHSCATTTTGGVKCWGSNFQGQLGIGRRDNRLPAYVMGAVPVLFASGFEGGM